MHKLKKRCERKPIGLLRLCKGDFEIYQPIKRTHSAQKIERSHRDAVMARRMSASTTMEARVSAFVSYHRLATPNSPVP